MSAVGTLRSKIKSSVPGWRLIGGPFLFGFLLLLTPLLLMILLSFWTQNYLKLDRTFTINNYVEVFSHPVYFTLIKRSLNISLLVTLTTVLLAFPVAYYISFYGGKRKAFLLFLIT
ncbi:MAG: ABC transporter permease, partial [Proteobacteria bacterium]|nr:ABC transporter permease [Pseudomonadota bacterium]